MFDLGIGSFKTSTLEELVSMLIAMAMCIALVRMIGFDVIVVGIVVAYAIPILAELTRRAWRWTKGRLSSPPEPQ